MQIHDIHIDSEGNTHNEAMTHMTKHGIDNMKKKTHRLNNTQ